MIIAEVYTGSGRPTGHHWVGTQAEYDELYDNGQGHQYRTFETQEEFEAAFTAGEHYQCHSPTRPGHNCPHCQEAEWV